ncbi:MAG: hypothetical protein EOS22_04210 [Mesorhizobium sp.]|uniref:DUF5681 domain-containing protein n=1 Tax=Mesorhizobium sp. TaxID=1871066 RepID=UPI000FE6D000|nr:DUF5681 domain-containing protein [Mesorhizobium sp.]RWD31632.1 MAG: hypothetical protein EOS22_04210 [Mesorhizobium sp.]TJW70706.1 MAG: hypothetical protein E5V29_03545 [Mesorhizobium sp.]
MSDQKDDDEGLGYGKPPKHARFQPGQSGNPKGRPKTKSKSFATGILAELEQSVVVRENGRELKLTKRAVIVKTLVAKAMKGDVRALKEIKELLPQQFQHDSDVKPSEAVSAEEAELLERFVERRLFGRSNTNAPTIPASDETTRESHHEQ